MSKKQHYSHATLTALHHNNSMSEIKLVLTDFDGTVAEMGKHIVSDAVRQSVIECEDNGIQVVPVTGRYHHMAQPVLEILGFDGLGVFDNGATIQECVTGTIVWSKWMDPQVVRQVARICAPVAYDIDYTSEHIQHTPTDDELELIDDTTQSAPYVYALIDSTKIDSVKDALRRMQGITFYTAPSTNNKWSNAVGIQVNDVAADKFHGVDALRDIVGIAKEQTLAIGDGDNDLALFDNAGTRVAMGNATNLLKTKADYTVASVDQDGFAEAMNRFVLNK